MLNQLIEQINLGKSIPQKFAELEQKASTLPSSSKDIIDLLSLCKYRLDEKEYPMVKHTEIFVAFLECKQILIASGDYYFI